MSPTELLAAGWVRNGYIWVHPAMKRQAASATRSDDDLIDEFMSLLEANFDAAPRPTTHVVAQRICSNCGCLLHPGEVCPSCQVPLLLWCERAAIAHSWRPIPYVPAEEVAAA